MFLLGAQAVRRDEAKSTTERLESTDFVDRSPVRRFRHA
jgi:hypothetical protein